MKNAIAFVLALALGACKPASSETPNEAVATAAPTAAPAEAPAARLMGPLTEDAFKKLHELKTDAPPSLRGTMVELPSAKAYLSIPPGVPTPMPGIVVVHEWWGLNDHIKHYADRLAAEGYATLAVDLYGGTVAQNPDEAMAAMKVVDAAKAEATLLEGYAFLAEDGRVQANRRGVIGWCFGGKWALNLGLAAPDIDAVVMYYGHVPESADALRGLKAPLLGIFGNADKSIPPATVDQFEKNLKDVGAKATILRFDADHAFANPSNPRYDQTTAEAAWLKARAFFAEHLQG